jgi:hypothetical protein
MLKTVTRFIGLVAIVISASACSETTIGSASGEYTEVTLPVLEARAERHQGNLVKLDANLEGYRPYDMDAMSIGPCQTMVTSCLGLSIGARSGGSQSVFAVVRADSPLYDEILTLDPKRSSDVMIWGEVVGSGGWGVTVEIHKAVFRSSFL